MKKLSIPMCYFPSTILFVDDSRDFLLNFVLQLDEGLAYRIFESPKDALDCIHARQCELEQLSRRCLSEYTDVEHCPLTNYTVNLNLAAIHAEVYNPQRFSEISVVVVDYAMPGMNGLEFCKQMENSAIKKILLTGQADEKMAIQAFNDGLIDKYIKKSDPSVTKLITESISQLQQNYFQNMSDTITRMLSVNSPTCLNDAQFIKFFQQLRESHYISEFYLSDNSGSFLMLDSDANTSFLIVKTERDLRAHYDLALDHGAPSEILDALKSGEKIPAFWPPRELQTNWDDWSTYLLTAKKITGSEVFYYAYVEGNALFDIRNNRIFSYNSYLDEIDAQELSIG
jgi:CheY-like chemotaxis protein